jgi:hypothetical protein
MLAADVTLSYSIHCPVVRQKDQVRRDERAGLGPLNGTLSGSNLSPPVGLSVGAAHGEVTPPFQGATQAFRRFPGPVAALPPGMAGGHAQWFSDRGLLIAGRTHSAALVLGIAKREARRVGLQASLACVMRDRRPEGLRQPYCPVIWGSIY